jgi:hypothetical protein
MRMSGEGGNGEERKRRWEGVRIGKVREGVSRKRT